GLQRPWHDEVLAGSDNRNSRSGGNADRYLQCNVHVDQQARFLGETTGGADVVGLRGCAVVRDRRQPAALHVELLSNSEGKPLFLTCSLLRSKDTEQVRKRGSPPLFPELLRFQRYEHG